jgi:hypothetical protein
VDGPCFRDIRKNPHSRNSSSRLVDIP